MSEKPFGIKSYGSIGHLPSSRLGPGDHKLHEGMAEILTAKGRKHQDRSRDTIIVQEKLDGSNVGIGKLDGNIIPLVRSGYRAESSPYVQHHLFASWVHKNWNKFHPFLSEGERLCGEWLAQAHGTRYNLTHDPFVAFDLFRDGNRILYVELKQRCEEAGIETPHLLHFGVDAPCSVDHAMALLGPHGHHGAIDPAEGAVWRCEAHGKVDFLGKYVRPDKKDGVYLPELNGGDAYWNWRA